MADLFQSGMSFLASHLKSSASQTVTYHRGDDEVEIQATIGRFSMTFDSFGGTLQETEDLDFIVTAADLVLSGSAIEPRRGDWIEYRGHQTVSRPDGTSKPPFEVDEYGISYRIHTKRGIT